LFFSNDSRKGFLPECGIAELSRGEKHRQKRSLSGLVSKLTFTVNIIHLNEKTVKVSLSHPWAILENPEQIRGKNHISSHFFLIFLVFSPVFENRGKIGERISPLPDALFLSIDSSRISVFYNIRYRLLYF
jgi:hypothetical protein